MGNLYDSENNSPNELEPDGKKAKKKAAKKEKKPGKISGFFTWLKTRRKRTKALIAIVLVIVIVGGGVFAFGRKNRRQAMTGVPVQSATVTKGSLSTTVEGTGTLTNADADDLQIPAGIKIKKVKVSAGDEVKKGDTLATVDKTSLRAALEETQEELDSVNKELSDEADNDTTKYVESSVEGRVKKIYAEKNVDVSTTILNKGALMLISLDGKMAVDVETSVSLKVGQEVTVRLSDGDSVTGTVTDADDSSCTVTVTDKGTGYKEEVTVYTSAGKKVGTGKLYINKESKVTASSGTVSSILVSENEYVSEGDDLLKLKGDFESEEYLTLEAQKEDLEEKLESLLKIAKKNTITAQEAGIITSVSIYDNTESGSSDSSSGSSTSTSSGSSSGSSGTISGLTGTSAVISGSRSAASSGNTSSSVSASHAAYANGSTAASVSTVKAVTLSTSAAGTVKAVTLSTSAAGTAKAVKLSAASTGENSEGASTASVMEASESSTEAADSTTASESTESNVSGISSIGNLGVTAPVTGAAPVTSVSGTGYSGSVSWSPSAGTFAAETAYTAKVVLKAASGYSFSDGISISSSGATVSGVKVSGSGEGNSVSLTLSFAKTGKSQSGSSSGDNTSGGSSQNSTNNSQNSSQNTNNSQNGNNNGTANGNSNTTTNQGTGTLPNGSAGTGSSSASGSSGLSLGSGSSAAASSGSASSSSGTTSSASTTDSDTNTEMTTAFSVSSGKEMTLSVDVDEMDILSISEGQTATVTLDAVDDTEFEGKITGIDKNGTTNSGTTKYPVEITLTKEDSMLAGMNASVTITVSEVSDALLIPSSAITEEGNASYVYTAKDEKSGELSGKTEVQTGLTDGTNTVITSGLSEGDTVYYSGTSGTTSTDSSDSSESENGFGGGNGGNFGGGSGGGNGGGTPPSGGNGGGPGGQ